MRRAPMLAESADTASIPAFCEDNSVFMGQKVDGRRLLCVIEGGTVTGINRSGEPTGVPKPIAQALARCPVDAVLDGELLPGNTLWLFDAPEIATIVTPPTRHEERLAALETLVSQCGIEGRHVRLLPTARTTAEKLALAKRVDDLRAEGLMVKDRDGPYVYGDPRRPDRRTRHTLKIKLWKDVDAIAVEFGRDGHDNIVLAVYDGDQRVEIGEVTRQAGDGARVQLGDVVTVKYLAWSGTRLIQPTRPRLCLRTDKRPEECLLDQLIDSNTREVIQP